MLGGAAATESRVRGELGGGRVIHFATHGIVRDDSPLDSFLALGTGSNSDAEDGRLTAQDIYGLELNADLVFLSACRSGRGKVTGDGVVGLTRSFVYAGTPTVVATLWDVADEPTRRLVPEFYRGYLQHARPGRALRTAQLRLLGDLRAGRIRVATPAGPLILPENPALWAAFIVLGEP
jgi:CHAT domain-containing protein